MSKHLKENVKRRRALQKLKKKIKKQSLKSRGEPLPINDLHGKGFIKEGPKLKDETKSKVALNHDLNSEGSSIILPPFVDSPGTVKSESATSEVNETRYSDKTFTGVFNDPLFIKFQEYQLLKKRMADIVANK